MAYVDDKIKLEIPRQGEPRWPALAAVLAASGLFYALPQSLKAGPDWVILIIPVLLAVPGVFFPRLRKSKLVQACGYASIAIVTLALIASLTSLVLRLPTHKETPAELLRAASALWVANILIFAAWYWRLDAGGPYQRDLRESHTDGAFLFPQMTLSPEIREEMGEGQWSPHFIDYLFLAFNTSTAFSPTDVAALSRWAKALMMVQALISLATIAFLAARAVNIL